ncbi:hypothetical protein SESBI_18447 [Sesbania bispinosa]|nr:hypothetical protein SESBI_18447 [Sesbania bispinosa]
MARCFAWRRTCSGASQSCSQGQHGWALSLVVAGCFAALFARTSQIWPSSRRSKRTGPSIYSPFLAVVPAVLLAEGTVGGAVTGRTRSEEGEAK